MSDIDNMQNMSGDGTVQHGKSNRDMIRKEYFSHEMTMVYLMLHNELAASVQKSQGEALNKINSALDTSKVCNYGGAPDIEVSEAFGKIVLKKDVFKSSELNKSIFIKKQFPSIVINRGKEDGKCIKNKDADDDSYVAMQAGNLADLTVANRIESININNRVRSLYYQKPEYSGFLVEQVSISKKTDNKIEKNVAPAIAVQKYIFQEYKPLSQEKAVLPEIKIEKCLIPKVDVNASIDPVTSDISADDLKIHVFKLRENKKQPQFQDIAIQIPKVSIINITEGNYKIDDDVASVNVPKVSVRYPAIESLEEIYKNWLGIVKSELIPGILLPEVSYDAPALIINYNNNPVCFVKNYNKECDDIKINHNVNRLQAFESFNLFPVIVRSISKEAGLTRVSMDEFKSTKITVQRSLMPAVRGERCPIIVSDSLNNILIDKISPVYHEANLAINEGQNASQLLIIPHLANVSRNSPDINVKFKNVLSSFDAERKLQGILGEARQLYGE